MTKPGLQELLDQIGDLFVEGSPHAKALGLKLVELKPARAVIEAPYDDRLVGDPDTGVLHGGVATALIDHTCGLAAFSGLGGEAAVVTLDLRIDYMRAAAPGKSLIAEATCDRVTAHVAFVTGLAHDGDPSDPVATARAAFIAPKPNVAQAKAARAALKEQGHEV